MSGLDGALLIWQGPRRLLAWVIGPSDRTLRFEYGHREFGQWIGSVLTRVIAPGGIEVSFDYDAASNLVRASREALASERYEYAWPDDPFAPAAHLLKATLDELSGARQSYTWSTGYIGLQGDVQVAAPFVGTVSLPTGGERAFVYDMTALASRSDELTTQVTDARGGTTEYRMNA